MNTQCLIGFYNLLGFETLVEKSTVLKEDNSNYYSIAKCLWHSLWSNSETTNETFEQRRKIIEIFYILIKNDLNVLKWLFESIGESFKANKLDNPTNSFLISLEIIETLSSFYSADKEITLNDLPVFVLDTFESYIQDLTNNNLECLSRFFDCMRLTFQNLNKVDKRFNKMDQIVETLLELVVQNNSDLFSNSEIILKASFIFKVYAVKFVKLNLNI